MAKGPYYPNGPKGDQNPNTVDNAYSWNKTWSDVYKKDKKGANSKMGKEYAAKANALGTMKRLLKGKSDK